MAASTLEQTELLQNEYLIRLSLIIRIFGTRACRNIFEKHSIKDTKGKKVLKETILNHPDKAKIIKKLKYKLQEEQYNCIFEKPIEDIDTSSFDITSFIGLFQNCPAHCFPTLDQTSGWGTKSADTGNSDSAKLVKLRTQRNLLFHIGVEIPFTTNELFKEEWERCTEILVSLGAKKEEIDSYLTICLDSRLKEAYEKEKNSVLLDESLKRYDDLNKRLTINEEELERLHGKKVEENERVKQVEEIIISLKKDIANSNQKRDSPEYHFNLFHEIPTKLSSKWKEFGRLLNLEEHVIDIIEADHLTCYERAYQCMKTKNEMSKEKCLKSDWLYWKSILIQLDMEGLNAIQCIEDKYPILLRYITDIEHPKVDYLGIYDGCGMFGHDATNQDNFETIPINEEIRIKVYMGAGEIKTFSLRKLKDLPHLQEEYFNNYPLLKDITKYDFSKDALTRECQILSMLSTWLNGDGFVIRGYNVDKHFELFTKGFNDKLSNDDSHITIFSQKQSVIVHIEIVSDDIHESIRKNLRQIKLFRSLHADSIDKGIVHISLVLHDNNINIKQVETICNECVSLQLIAPLQIVKDINQWKSWWDNVNQRIEDMKYELKDKTSTEDVTQTLLSSIITFMALTEFNLPSFATNPKKQIDEIKKLILLTPEQLEILYSKHKRLIIKGCYGSGKSIVAQQRIKFILKSIKDDEWLYYLCHDSNTYFVDEMNVFAKELNRDKLKVCNNDSLIYCGCNYGCDYGTLSSILSSLSNKHGDNVVHVFVEEFDGESLDELEVKKLKNIINQSFAESHILLVARSMESQRCLVKSSDSTEIRSKSYQYEKLVNEVNFHCHHLKYSMRSTTHINKLINIAMLSLEPEKVSCMAPDIAASRIGSPMAIVRFVLKELMNNDFSQNEIRDKDKSLKHYTICNSPNNSINCQIETQYKFIGEQKMGHNIKGIVPIIYHPFSKEICTQSYKKQIFCITLLLDKIIDGKEKYVIVCMNKPSFTCLHIALEVKGTYKYTESGYEFSNGNYQILLTDYTNISGCEYANMILIYSTYESHLKHHVVNCISRCYFKFRIMVLNGFGEYDSTLMQILSEWEEEKLMDSFKVVISSDQQFFLECDTNKTLLGNDKDYLKFNEVYQRKTAAEEDCYDELMDKLYFGAVQPLKVEDKEAELAMIKRHQSYIENFKKYKMIFPIDGRFASIMDRRLFISRFETLLHNTTICDQCDQQMPIPIECRYRCLECLEFDICQNCYRSGNNPKKHSETHTIICLRYKCASCGGYIVGTRFNCTVCPDFDLCLGCFDREPFPTSHNSSHKMTRSSNLPRGNGASLVPETELKKNEILLEEKKKRDAKHAAKKKKKKEKHKRRKRKHESESSDSEDEV